MQILTDLIEIEWKISWHRTIQTRFQKWCPTITETMWSTFVPFAYTGHPREYGLSTWEIKEKIHNELIFKHYLRLRNNRYKNTIF